MNRNAIEQANIRLIKAEKALAALNFAEYFDDAESAWSDFLIAASGIYSKLEQGAKGYPRSEPWFGREKSLRKTDPLLRYLHFARNADEHGIEYVTNRAFENINLKFNERRKMKGQKIDETTQEPIGEQFDCMLAGPTIKLIRIYDSRYGDYADPPETHLGEIVTYGTSFPHDVGEVGLTYLIDMIRRAERLPF